MARPVRRLSAITVKNAKPGLHPDGGNLYLQVTDSGSKSWTFRFGRGGRERYMGLGPVITVSLAEAREEATRCRALLLKGIDPIESRKAERAQNELAQHQGTTFEECALRLLASHETSWSDKHRLQWRNSLATYAYPVLGPVAVQSIDTALVLKVLEPIWQEKPETASRVRGRIEAVLDWAKARGIRSGENRRKMEGAPRPPAPLAQQGPQGSASCRSALGEIGAYMRELRERDGIAARALEFIILTAARTGEVVSCDGTRST